MPATDLIRVQDLVVRYPETTAVDGISFTVGTGGVTAVLGPNGAGKTTTIEVCEGLRRPTAGQVRVLGLDPLRFSASDRSRIGVMLQSGGIPSAARAVEFIRQVASLHADPLDPLDLCDRLDLTRLGRTPYRRMSGGQKQTMALAAALVGRPELVILDEPTAGLDPAARVSTWELMTELRDAGVTVILSTHSMEEAERVADTVLVMDRGRIVAHGSLDELTGGDAHRIVLTTLRPLDADALAAHLGPGFVVEHAQGRTTISGGTDDSVNARVTTWCGTHDVGITTMTSGRRTLEDVFFELTGRGLS